MSTSSSTDSNRNVTYAVEFVLEVDSRAFAEDVLDALPDATVPDVDARKLKTYVDETALGYPAVGASVPFYDLATAETLYASVQKIDNFDQHCRSGTIAIREYREGVEDHSDPLVIVRTTCP